MQNEKCKMGSETPVVVPVTEEYHVAQARSAAKLLANGLGLSEVAVYSVATAVSELANNLFFHTSGGGTISLSAVRRNGSVGLEIVAEDEGPGIADVKLAMQDGFTTNGGLGGGLPGVERLMDEFEIESSRETGTRIVARIWSAGAMLQPLKAQAWLAQSKVG